MKKIFTLILCLILQNSFGQLLELQNRKTFTKKEETPIIKIKKVSVKSASFKNITYELARIKKDSISFSDRIHALDSINNSHFEKYAAHKAIFLELSPKSLFEKDSISSLLIENTYVIKDSLKLIKKAWSENLTNFNGLAKSKSSSDSSFFKSEIYAGYYKVEKMLEYLEEKALKKSQGFVKSIDTIVNKETENDKLVAFLPEINTFLGKAGFFAPSINLLGTQGIDGKSFSGTIKLFSTSLPTKEKIDWRTLAVSQTSEFGITADFIGGFNKKNSAVPSSIGIRFGSSYLIKRGLDSLNSKDTSSYNFGFFHSHLGIEFTAVPKLLAFYVDYNQQLIGTNLVIIKKNNPSLYDAQYNLGFYNTGVKFRISPTGALSQNLKKFPIYVDLNFIWVSKKYSEIDSYKSQRVLGDRVIPNIKVALKM